MTDDLDRDLDKDGLPKLPAIAGNGQVVDSLPGTIPPAVVMLAFEARHRRPYPRALPKRAPS